MSNNCYKGNSNNMYKKERKLKAKEMQLSEPSVNKVNQYEIMNQTIE